MICGTSVYKRKVFVRSEKMNSLFSPGKNLRSMSVCLLERERERYIEKREVCVMIGLGLFGVKTVKETDSWTHYQSPILDVIK